MPTPTYTPLATVTLGSSASSVTFANIGSGYRDLILVANGKFSSSNSLIRIRVGNGTVYTGSNYPTLYANSGPASVAYTGTAMDGGRWDNVEGLYTAHLMDYSATDKHKTVLVRNGSASFSSTQMNAHRWTSTSVINIIQVLSTDNTFASGTTFNLFGVIA
jgi:microcompartment protein CcmK/EutM